MKSDNTELIIGIPLLAVILGSIWWERNKIKILADVDSFLSLPWLTIGIVFISIVSSVTAFVLIRKRKKESLKEKKRQAKYKHKRRERFRKIIDKNLDKYSSKGMEEAISDIKDKLKKEYFHNDKEFRAEINEFFLNAKEKLRNEKEREERIHLAKKKQKQLEEKRIEQEQLEEQRLTQELFEFKKKKNNVEALPINHNYSQRVISQASFLMKRHLEIKQRDKQKAQEATEYYEKNDLDSEPYLEHDWEKKIYADRRKKFENGELTQKKNAEVEYQGKKLDKSFYRAKELDDEAKLRAVAQGFQHIRGIELDGFLCGGGFYIKKDNPRESPYHFYMKHLFAELHDNTQLEYQIDNRRVDVALLIEDFKLGIEVETGVNKQEQLLEKRNWLNKNFDEWFFVCRRKHKAKYAKYVDNKKSFCLTPKRAKEHILELLSPTEHLYDIGETS